MKRFYTFATAMLVFISVQLFGQPTAVCINGASIDLFPLTCTIELWGSDFDAASFSNDSEIIDWRINRVYDLNENDIIDPEELLTKPPVTKTIEFNYQDTRKIHTVQFWVIDENDEYDYCVTFVDLEYVSCDTESHNISGNIEAPGGKKIKDIDLTFKKLTTIERTVNTSQSGEYHLAHFVTTGNDFKAEPKSDSDILRGIDDADLKAILNHILNKEPFEDPYNFISADVNNDGKISILDVQILRKNLSEPSTGFPGNYSWRFIPKDYQFNFNPNFPILLVDFPEFEWVNNVQHDITDLNFIGIKIGDVVE